MVFVRLRSIIDGHFTTKAEWSGFHAFQLVRTLFVALLQPFLWSPTTMQTNDGTINVTELGFCWLLPVSNLKSEGTELLVGKHLYIIFITYS